MRPQGQGAHGDARIHARMFDEPQCSKAALRLDDVLKRDSRAFAGESDLSLGESASVSRRMASSISCSGTLRGRGLDRANWEGRPSGGTGNQLWLVLRYELNPGDRTPSPSRAALTSAMEGESHRVSTSPRRHRICTPGGTRTSTFPAVAYGHSAFTASVLWLVFSM
jgi:hypothetical protein